MGNPIEIDDAIILLLGADGGERQRGEVRGITRLEKLIFLLERETSSRKWLTEDAKFEPYNFGPFSQRVYQAVDTLSAAGLIQDSDAPAKDESDTWEERHRIDDVTSDPYRTRDFKVTERGWKYYDALTSELPDGALKELEGFKRKFIGLPLRQLVKYVYQRYETYTTRSLIREDILGSKG